MDDLRLFNKYAGRLRQAQIDSGKPGLLVGATRLIAQWCLDNGLRIEVMDFCEPMAKTLQSGDRVQDGVKIIIDDWLTTTHPDRSFSWAAGDGAINATGSGRAAVVLLRQLRRLVLPGSLVILRSLIMPAPAPPTAEVFESLSKGSIRSFSAFRHRVSQSLQPSFMEGVSVRKTRELILGKAVLESGGGGWRSWTAEEIATLDAYDFEDSCLCYPTLTELREITGDGFKELDIAFGDYEMAQLAPTIVYRAC